MIGKDDIIEQLVTEIEKLQFEISKLKSKNEAF